MKNRMKWMVTMLLLFAAATTLTAKEGKTYVVSVGINKYADKGMIELKLSVKDARTITSIYKSAGNAEVLLLTDNQATKANIVSSMKQLFKKAQKDDTIIFFFSGHGSTGNLCAYDKNLMFKDIILAMKRCDAGRKIMYLDACFTGSMRRETRRRHQNSVDWTAEELAERTRKADVMLFLSSLDNESSLELGNAQNGLFTTYLREALTGAADKNNDRVVTAKELFDYVTPKVENASGNRQHPAMWGRFSDNMPVISLRKQ